LGLFVAQLRARLESAEREHVVERVETSLSVLNELFDALLDISKLDAGVLATNPVTFPINRLLERLGATFAGAASAKGLALRIVPCSAWVRADPILLERILLNFVSNAVRYTPQGGVLVGCRRHAGTLDIEVLDTGPGVPADQREKIFGEFVRLGDRDGRGQPGLGLGLAIVQRLCDLMALPMTFESALGRGSRFSVTLPRAPSQVGHHERPEPALIIDSSAPPVVVVIEDDALVLEGMSGLLRSWGCHVVPFGSAKAALAGVSLWEGSPPNLIIADYSLPGGKSGLELIATLRSAFGGEIAAFLISGDTSPAAFARCVPVGFTSYTSR
jgi:two-component system, sensor histidine kinase